MSVILSGKGLKTIIKGVTIFVQDGSVIQLADGSEFEQNTVYCNSREVPVTKLEKLLMHLKLIPKTTVRYVEREQ